MFELMSIENNEMTRVVKLKNITNGTIEECFDDSAVVSNENFEFMEIGHNCECKIKLFGKAMKVPNAESVLCTIIDENAVIGNKSMVKVAIENDEYYIPYKKVVDFICGDKFYFNFTRKDLVQVNDVVHADML